MKKLFAAITLSIVLMFGSSFAYAGLLVSDFTGGSAEEPCTEVDYTIVPTGLMTIVPTGFGIIVFTETTDCTIVPTGK